MKYFIAGFLTVIILAVILWLIFKPDIKPPDNSREVELVKEIDNLKSQIVISKAKIDSLETVKQKVKTQIVIRDRQIDENISKDSANARVEFNQSLTENGELPDPIPDNPHYVSFRDLGNSAKIMQKVPKLQLQISICEEQSFNKDIIIADQEYIIEGKDDLIEIKDNNIEYYKDLYEDEASFWNSKELWFGIGVLVSAGIVFASGGLK